MKRKINLNFYFQTYLWFLKRFHEGIKGLHKTNRGALKKCENKKSSYFNINFLNARDGMS